MTIEEIKKTINDAKRFKHEITVKDISYVLLWREYKDIFIAYKSIFDDASNKEIEKYHKSKAIDFLKGYIFSNFGANSAVSKYDVDDMDEELDYSKDITFEENKEAMLRKIAVIERKIEQGKIPDKDGEKMVIDIRTRLNDKFSVAEKVEQQYIIVEKKFNHICPHLRKECYIYTKEDLIEKYGLIDKEELKLKYDLVPKQRV